jgi:metal-sulfur cluster biosynthetic enzyme
MNNLEERIIDTLKQVYDPELRQDVVSLKLVRDLKADEKSGKVSLVFRPTAFICPIGIQLALMIKQAISKVEGVRKVNMEVVDFVYAKQAMEYLKQLDEKEKEEN